MLAPAIPATTANATTAAAAISFVDGDVISTSLPRKILRGRMVPPRVYAREARRERWPWLLGWEPAADGAQTCQSDDDLAVIPLW